MSRSETITYRLARLEDLDALVALMKELIDELGPHDQNQAVKGRLHGDLKAALASDDIVLYLACVDEGVVGLSRGDILRTDPIFRLRDDHHCGYVDQMYVQTPYRRKGIGRALLALCEDWFRSHGIEHCILHAAVRAIRFYARAGYQSNREMFKRL